MLTNWPGLVKADMSPDRAEKEAAKEAADEPVNKRKRMLHLAILFLLLAIILYGTYELLG